MALTKTSISTPETRLAQLERRLNNIYEAIEEVNYRMYNVQHSRGPIDTGEALARLRDVVFDLSTWHPTFDDRTGTLEWERKDDD